MPQKDTQQGEITMQQIYDLLMRHIEPDLTTTMIPLLDEVYADETPEERKERGERYKDAFLLFANRFDALTSLWKEKILTFKQEVITHLHESADEEQKEKISELENFFDQQ